MPLGYSELETMDNMKDTITGSSKKNKNLTLKNRRKEKKQKVNDFLEAIENQNDDDDTKLYNFNSNENMEFPPHPKISSNKFTKPMVSNPSVMNDIQNQNMYNDDSEDDTKVTREMFDNLTQHYVPYYENASNTEKQIGNKDMLLDKLNYMIHLLEEQQEEKTGHVAEEIILYCFLGVFVIFIVDSFARAGKYVR